MSFKSIAVYLILWGSYTMQSSALAQVPNSQQTNWTIASEGPQIDWSGIPQIDLTQFGADPSGMSFSDAAIQQVLSLYDDSIQIYLPSGDYLFQQTISLGSYMRLYGDGSEHTNLIFDTALTADAITASGTRLNSSSNLKTDIKRGEDFFRIDSTHSGMVNQFFYILDNDIDKTTSAWAAGSTGQIVKTVSHSGDTLFIESEFRRNFDTSKQAHILPIRPVVHLEISDLRINYLNPNAVQQYSNIRLNHVAHARISCIESEYCIFSHVELNSCYRVSVQNSEFKYGHDYGGGGRAYGVALQFGTSDALLAHCYFKTLRHSVLLQAGANGNVIFGNFSEDPYWTDVFLPSNSAGELVLHGNYPYANLFENNWVQNIVIDDSHGINGPYNAFLRNRATGYGIFMNFNPPTDSTHFIGNIVEGINGPGMYFIQGVGHTEVYNLVNNQVEPSNSQTALPFSFLNAPPDIGLYPQWPAIGPDLYPSINIIELAIDQQVGLCSPFLSNDQTSTSNTSPYPNPTRGKVFVPNPESVSMMRVYNSFGELIFASPGRGSFDLLNQPDGLYIMEIDYRNGHRTRHKIVLHN